MHIEILYLIILNKNFSDFTYNYICAGGDAYFPKEIGQLSQLEVLYIYININDI